MRDRVEIARRLLSERAFVRELERGGAGHAGRAGRAGHADAHPAERTRLLAHRAVAQALAWALDIDLNQMDIPQTLLSELAPEEQPTTVQLHLLELGDLRHPLVMWLVEIPAYHDERGPDYSTESWSCFLQNEQAHQLLAALTHHLNIERRQRPLELPTLGRRDALRDIAQSIRPFPAPPASPDVEGGYADYGGVAAFANNNDQDDDDQDDPPADALPPAAPKGA